MSLDPNNRVPSRGRSGQDLWPKWMWVAVPVLVVVVVAGLWWAIFSPSEKTTPSPTPSPTMRVLRPPSTQAPTLQNTLAAEGIATRTEITPTRPMFPLATFTPISVAVVTPTGAVTVQPSGGFAIGSKVKVTGTGGSGLNVRAGAGTGHARVKTLPDGTTVEIIGGPKDANGYTWYQIRDEAGVTGWAASRFLTQ